MKKFIGLFNSKDKYKELVDSEMVAIKTEIATLVQRRSALVSCTQSCILAMPYGGPLVFFPRQPSEQVTRDIARIDEKLASLELRLEQYMNGGEPMAKSNV